MPLSDAADAACLQEAERLIALARVMLTGEREQIVRDYLDHALTALEEMQT